MPAPAPLFITLDGIDGVGKSTQIDRLDKFLTDRGHDVMTVRDPGSTEIGGKLRSILLDSEITIHRRTEAMLFMASRCEMVETIIRPALDAGRTVISDRFLLANVVYQSVGGDVDAETLWKLGRIANGNLSPNLTVLLDMPATESMRRITAATDRMESRGTDYMESVRQAFLQQVQHSGQHHIVVDASQSPDAVSDQITKFTADHSDR